MGVRAPMSYPRQRSTALLMIPLALIVVIVVVDLRSPTSIHLGPLLVIAPALTPSFAGPRLTALVGAVAIAAQVLIAFLHGGITTSNHIAQITALTVLCVLIVTFTAIREHRAKQLARAQSVAEAAQLALLRPLPERLGPLRIATMYLAAEREAQIGGDLYTATRTAHGTRMVVGKVRGKGLAAVGESALVVSAFRLIAAQHDTLAELAATLDRNVGRYLADFTEENGDAVEHFITALLLDLPDDEPIAHLTNCGHPPPLLLRDGRAEPVDSVPPAPPLGVNSLGNGHYPDTRVPFSAGDTLLLYTDGSPKPATAPGSSTRSPNAPPSGRSAPPRHSCTTYAATWSPTSAIIRTTTPPSSSSDGPNPPPAPDPCRPRPHAATVRPRFTADASASASRPATTDVVVGCPHRPEPATRPRHRPPPGGRQYSLQCVVALGRTGRSPEPPWAPVRPRHPDGRRRGGTPESAGVPG